MSPKRQIINHELNSSYAYQQFGYVQVSSAALAAHQQMYLDITLPAGGFLYTYVAHESKVSNNSSVYFDDFNIVHTRNASTLQVLQTSDYYPFGAVSSSYQRENSVPNRYKYQSKEYQDDLGLNLYDFHWRQYDPWAPHTTTIDPKAEKFYHLSPYSWAAGNPMKYIDPDGREIVDADGNPVTYQTVNGQVIWSKNASADVQRVGNALLQTKTGTGRLDALVSSDTKVSIKVSGEVRISKNEETGKTTVRYGDTKITKFEKNADGTYSAKEATLTVFEGTIKTIVGQKKQLSGDAGEKQQIGIEGSIGAVAAHESIHAVDPGNVNQNLQNQVERKNNDIEKKPNQVEKQVQSELLKKKKNEN